MAAHARSAAFLIAVLGGLAGPLAPAWAQAPAAGPQSQPAGEEMIVTVRSNGVARGEFTVLRTPDGDFWLSAQDLPRLKVNATDAARRSAGGVDYYSLRALSARELVFDEATLSVSLSFPSSELEMTRIDLSGRPAPAPITTPPPSSILNYRASVRQSDTGPLQLRLAGELNVRIGEVLLRQEAKVETGRSIPAFARGTTQLIWDDRLGGRRVVAGDQLTAGGPFGTTFPAAGVSLTRLFAITPDVVRQPTASFQVAAATPSQVEVAVDGNTVYRTTVAPGPVSLDNLYYYNGVRDVRVTVTDATGRRQVYEQPFLFTDNVLAKGLHEYSYFFGRRAELRFDDRWHYRESAWQGFHRYGVSDEVTVEAGGEGSPDFASGGAGLTLRSDTLGLLSLGALASVDREKERHAQGWSARYAYIAPQMTLFAARRRLEPGFRSFSMGGGGIALLDETRLGGSTRLSDQANLSLDYARVHETIGTRRNYAVRLSSSVNRQTTLFAEYTRSRMAGNEDWAFNVYLRMELEHQRWVGGTFRSGADYRAVEAETGQQLPQGEGLGYRLGTLLARNHGVASDFTYGSATWNLKPVTVDLNASAQTQGGNAHYAEASVSGAVVALDGYVGATRPVSDGFALARLGVPQAGVDISLNSQVQGQTDADGNLLIPNVGAFGRQDVTLDDRQLSMEYNLARKRVTIAPAYKSGTLVNFGGRKLRAVSGQAWLVQGESRTALATRAWEMTGPGRLQIETARSGEFYLEDAPPGRYAGSVEVNGRRYSCVMDIPSFAEAVHELQDGLVCR
jgi:outer membrane usher protein